MKKTIKKIDILGNETWQDVLVCNICKKTLTPEDFVYEIKWTGWHRVKPEPGVAYGIGEQNDTRHICTECKDIVEKFLDGENVSDTHLHRPCSCDEYLELIYAIGYDYDGCEKPESLKELIDELVEYSTKARKCLHEGKLFLKDVTNGTKRDN